MSEEISVDKTMLFKKQEEGHNSSSEMLHGTYGVWHVGPNRNQNEKRDLITTNPYEKSDQIHHKPHKMWFFMIPMMHKMWRQKMHDRKQWISGMSNHEMDPQKLQEVFSKTHEAPDEQVKENVSSGTSYPRRFGFCKRRFSSKRKDLENEQQQNLNLVSKTNNVFYNV